ncbi:MAG: hypothetical protein K0S58_129 [Nitrospira sp.]|jgi:hypothetical protein|nr:hypothetical protein [Nitrospira sp.]
MLMLVFRSSLKDRVHVLLEQCEVRAYTELPETIGAGQSGPAEGVSFYPGVNSVILVAMDDAHAERVGQAVKAWCEEVTQRPGGHKPSIRIFTWPCRQLI